MYRHREGAHNSRLDALIDYMRANLHGPLELSELERRSGYSRLMLRQLFLSFFGCTPKQWIHQERLRRAERSLRT
jgi:transcriptional regulator GlxA family with amidase domain